MKLQTNLIQKLSLLLIVFSFTCIAASALADLNVTSYSVDPSSGCIGQPQILIFDVKNIGNAAVTGTTAIVTAGGTSTTISGISISAGATKKFIVSVPAFSSGSIMLDPMYSSNYMKAIYSNAISCSNSYTNTPIRRYLLGGSDIDRVYITSSESAPGGFSYEHDEGKMSTAWLSGTTPWFRFYNSNSGVTSHYYTTKTDQASLQDAINNNYAYEKVQGYIYTTQVSGTVPLYHLYKDANYDHFYTISDVEKNNAININGYTLKGTEGYVYPNPLPYDLTATNVWVSGTPTAGQSAIINYQVQNLKTDVSSYNVGIYLDSVLQGYENKGYIATGATATGSLSVTVSTSGNHVIKAFVDYDGQISETNESNNQYSQTIYWQPAPPKPDLALTGIIKDPYNNCNGQDQVIILNVSNIGAGNATNAVLDVTVNNSLYQRITGINLTSGQMKQKIFVIPAKSYTYATGFEINPGQVIDENGNTGNNVISHVVTIVACPNTFTGTGLNRLYNSIDKDHFYTIKQADYNNAIAHNYASEGTEGNVSSTWLSGSLTLWRFYHNAQKIHYYTTSPAQLQSPLDQGFTYEGSEGYLYNAAGTNRTELWHLYNNTITDHLYTTNTTEKTLKLTQGYVDQGSVGWVYKPAEVVTALLPAPKLAVSLSDPVSGQDFKYMYRIEAHPMNKDYRTMVHFVDDSGNIIINDDHNLQDEKNFGTSSASFEGYIEYPRTVKIPYYFTGNLSIIFGFYDYTNQILGDRVPLDPKYATDIGYNRYLVGNINVTPQSEYRIALEVGGQDPRIENLPALFPELFKYSAGDNENLAQALLLISDSFRSKGITVNKELLIAIVTTLQKEVGGIHHFLPKEEADDWGMGPGCSSPHNIDGVIRCRLTPYEGGLDYKGRGYIQITGKSNYRTACGEDCVNPLSSVKNDLCKCNNKDQCSETDVNVCPALRAMEPDRTAPIFVSYYLSRNLVSKANAMDYYDVGAGINGDSYPADFEAVAKTYVTLFNKYPDKVTALLLALGNENPYREGTRVKEVGDNKIYLVENGKFRHIVDETSFCYNITNDLTQISTFKEIPAGEISRLNALGEDITAPASFYSTPLPPTEGTLVRDVCSIDVYVYEGGKYRWIVNEDTFNARGYKFSDVVTVAYNRIAQQNNYGTPIKYEPTCALPVKHKNTFTDVDSYDNNYKDVVLMKENMIFSYPLEQEASYNPSSSASCGNYNICVNYRGTYSQSKEGVGTHSGVDITAPAFTTKVYAIADGIIVKDDYGNKKLPVLSAYGEDAYRTKEQNPNFYCGESGFCPGYNNGNGGFVIIKHPDLLLEGKPVYSVYMHMRYFNPDLKPGVEVKAGTWLGNLSDSMMSKDNRASGANNPAHLHFQIIKEFNNEAGEWPYEAPNTYIVDKGFLNKITVNPIKMLNNLSYRMPQDLKTYYNCMQSVDASGLGSQEIRNVDILYPYTNNVRLAWTDTPSATYQIALSKTSDFSAAQLIETSAPYLDMEVDDTPTFAKVKSLATSWSPQFILYNNESKICSKLDRYIDNYAGCGLSIVNSDINSEPSDTVVLRDSNVSNSQIHGNYTIEDASVSSNIMDSGKVYWKSNYFEGRVDLSKIKGGCLETTDMEIKGPSSFKICPGTYADTLKVSSSNIAIDLNQVTITGGIFASSGYTIDNASADLQGINGSATKAQINAILSTKQLFENITIMNGNFVNCDVGMNLSIVRNLKITNNTFTNCQNGIIAASINSEISGNTITLASTSQGTAIGVGGMDTLISSNIINGNYEQGIGMLGWNLTAQSNTVDNANKGIGMLGFYNNVKGNSISNSKDAISGLFVLGANVSNNRMDTNENGISVVCFDSSIADSNVILSSSNKAIELKQFLKNMCSKNSSIKNNKLIAQTSPSIRIMKTDVDGDKVIYDNNLLNNTYCDSEANCGTIIPPNNTTNQTNTTNNTVVPKTYTIVYVPGELRNVSGIVMGNNFEDVYTWKQSPMQKINGTYQLTFENISAGERDFNIKYNVDGVSYDYYGLTTQGMSGDVYVNGIKIDCGYTGYYSDRLAANYKIVADGNGNFTKPSASGNLPGCDQLCAPERLSKRAAWLSNGSLYIPDAVFTGNCYKEKNGTNYGLIFDCPVLGKDIKLSEKFDSWQRSVNFTARTNQSCGLTDTTFKQKFYAADIEARNRGFNQVYSYGEYNYWLDLNPCHPDVKLVDNSAHTIMPSNRTTTNPVCG